MGKKEKSPAAEMQSLNNAIHEEIRIIGTRQTELESSYRRGSTLISPFDNQFEEEFGDAYRTNQASLHSALQFVSLAMLPMANIPGGVGGEDNADKDTLSFAKEHIKKSQQARNGAKNLRDEMNSFFLSRNLLKRDVSSEDLALQIRHLQDNLKRLKDAAEQTPLPDALQARVDAACEELEPFIHLPSAAQEIDRLPLEERFELQRQIQGQKEANSFWQVFNAIEEQQNNVYQHKIQQLQDEIERLVIERVSACAGEQESEAASDYLALGYEARQAVEPRYDRDYYGEEASGDLIIAELESIKQKLEEK